LHLERRLRVLATPAKIGAAYFRQPNNYQKGSAP
jgi:hypothetical protein